MLSRLEGELGTFFALTGKTLKGKDVYNSGIATKLVTDEENILDNLQMA